MSEAKQPDERKPSPLFKKLNEIMRTVDNIPKDAKNQHFGYRFVSADTVADTIRGAIATVGLAFSTSVISRELVELTTSKGKNDVRWVIEYEFAFHDPDSGETLARRWYGEAGADDDKGINKANTAAEKYFLLKMFVVSTADDADNDRDGERGGGQKRKSGDKPLQGSDERGGGQKREDDAISWYDDPAQLARVYQQFVKYEYGVDIDDVKRLLAAAGITYEVMKKYPTLEEGAPAIRKLVDEHLARGKAQPVDKPDNVVPFTPDLSAQKAQPTPQANEIATAMVKTCDQWLGDDGATALKAMGKSSWGEFEHVTAAQEALAKAIHDYQLAFLCRAVTYKALGTKGGTQTLFHMPGSAKVVVMNGGRGEIEKLVGAKPTYDAFAKANGLESWKTSNERKKLTVPLEVRWKVEGDKQIVTSLTPDFPDSFDEKKAS
jgi:hypothetical protein